MAGTGSDDSIRFRDALADDIIRMWPDDVPPDRDALRSAIAAVTKTWVATHAHFTFDREQGPRQRWMVQTPWSANGIGDA